MPFLSRIQTYIMQQAMKFLALVLGITAASILIVDTVEQMNTIGTRADINLLTAASFTLMRLPGLIEQTLPFTLLISTMLTFRQLSRTSELAVMRASGLSAWRFLTPPVLLAFILGVFTMTVISPAGSYLTSRFETIRAELVNPQGSDGVSIETGIWLLDGDSDRQIIIHAQSADETGSILNQVVFLEQERARTTSDRGGGFVFVRRLEADHAKLEPGLWRLQNTTEFIAGELGRDLKTLTIRTEMEPGTLLTRLAPPRTISFWTLPDFIDRSARVGLNVTRYQVRWFSLITLPILFIAMSLIGAMACLRLVRLGRTAPFIAFGAVGAIGLYFVNELASSLATSGALPPIVAAGTPPVFTIVVCLALLTYHEDG